MSRSTQIIGLTKRAKEFVKNLKEMESDTHTLGMFEEKIPLRKWKYGNRENSCIREVLQDSPWSSGPMLFYCLEYDMGNGATTNILQWIVDPTTKGEVNYEEGTYWV